MSTSRRTDFGIHASRQRVFEPHNAIGYSMRVMRVIYVQHRGGTFDNALSFVLRAVSQNTGLIPDLQDADPVYIRLQERLTT